MNMWLSVNRNKLDRIYYDLEALRLKGYDDLNVVELKHMLKSMENEITNISKDLQAAQEENERLLELFTEKDEE